MTSEIRNLYYCMYIYSHARQNTIEEYGLIIKKY